ncbi:helix-turn-helix domain-containing protein [Bacillus pumilus]|uniref:PucR family transcriptional regulator n=1 Tax=Bacillus pumilus TaxID=1408 RepID=UPI001B3A616E|nr:helix-turn-helix domain-containing protein [Bacillus pumilus]MBQ4816388.1 helix-turn-helix domain-containing protein [Bacillus pumilus]WIG31390.1 helix-turn-helix domain-containing protein [Bacillus pumilus]
MNIVDNQFEALQKIAERIRHPVYLYNQHGRLLCNLHITSTSPEWIRILPFFQSRTPLYFSIIDTKQTFSVFPIDLTEQTCEYVIIPSFILPLDKTLQVIIEQAVHEISMARMRQYTAQQTAKRARNEGFRRWIEGASSSQQDATYIAKAFGLNVDSSYLCMICQLDPYHENTHFLEQQLMIEQVVDLLDSALPHSPFPSFLFVKGDMVIVLMEETGNWSEMSEKLLSFLKQIQILVSIQVNHTISFGASLTSCRITHLSEGYSEALEALQAGHLSAQSEYIQFYQAKDVPDLLKLIPRKDLVTFHQMHLHPLYEAGQNLLHTISVYLETHCHISETAKRLSIHRNTVIYRLEKCEELLRISLKDPEVTLRLRLALRIQMILSPHPD